MNPLAPLTTVADHHPGLKVIVLTDHLLPAEYVGWPLVEQDAPAVADSASTSDRPNDDAAALIFITSGTTGTPKATVGFHGNLASRWSRLAQWLQFGPEDVHLAQLPLSHGFGLMMTVAALLTGGQLVLLSRFSGERALELISARGVTVLNGAPTHFRSILQRLDETRHDVRTLRLSVGTAAAFSPELVNAIWDRLNVQFMYMYGSSEGVGVATTDPVDILLGSVGRPALGSVKVVDRDRREVPLGTVGEVAFSRDVYPVTYWGAHTRSGTGAEPAWYYSGDLGRLDHEGRLFIFGRLKHLIDRGGLKIDPVEVETALLRCPDVFDAAVIGRPDPMLGETVCACVVPTVGSLPTLGDLRAHLRRVLSPFKLPETLEVVDEIPRTPVGKVDLSRLRDMITADPELLRP
jgi:long-chain acyl-CoA synthetase